MEYQWYPGHMTKAIRMMQEEIKLIDIVIEVVDARIPLSGRNPDIDKLSLGKYRLLLLNKKDLISDSEYFAWKDMYESKGIRVLGIDARSAATVKNIDKIILDVCKDKLERDRKRGIQNRPIRAMVVGIPNVGKSTFINSLCKRACTKTGNKPGVTKGKQWIRLNKNIELLDTPGILWPKFEDPTVGRNLAFVGSINDEILPTEDLAMELISFLKCEYPGVLADRYSCDEDKDSYQLLCDIALFRKCLMKQGLPNTEKMSAMLLDDFRSGKLGKICLEKPE